MPQSTKPEPVGQQTLTPPTGKKSPTRVRSVPYPRGYVIAVFLSAVHYFAILAVITTAVCFIIAPSHFASRFLAASFVATLVTWFIAFLKRRSTFCPLCKGTPLINSGALTHEKSFQLHPFNHGVTAILSILATQKFCCMYCGTTYDLLKNYAYRRGEEKTFQDDSYEPEDDDSPTP